MKEQWLAWLGHPSEGSDFEHTVRPMGGFETEFCKGEYYLVANGKGTFQRTLLVLPRESTGPVPAVVVPFYYPEAMIAHGPGMRNPLIPSRAVDHLMEDLVKRGYGCISAESYHLTYLRSEKDMFDFFRWQQAAEALLQDHPQWSGVGKLVADTQLLIDFLEQDVRIDSSRIGIAGHSLGGKMALYTGCLDERIKVILASDLGLLWDQTNWSDLWYWGNKVEFFKKEGVDHTSLLACAAPKPFCLLAGFYDNEESARAMRNTAGYEGENARYLFCDNHASGHNPPPGSLEKGYEFLAKYL